MNSITLTKKWRMCITDDQITQYIAHIPLHWCYNTDRSSLWKKISWLLDLPQESGSWLNLFRGNKSKMNDLPISRFGNFKFLKMTVLCITGTPSKSWKQTFRVEWSFFHEGKGEPKLLTRGKYSPRHLFMGEGLPMQAYHCGVLVNEGGKFMLQHIFAKL